MIRDSRANNNNNNNNTSCARARVTKLKRPGQVQGIACGGATGKVLAERAPRRPPLGRGRTTSFPHSRSKRGLFMQTPGGGQANACDAFGESLSPTSRARLALLACAFHQLPAPCKSAQAGNLRALGWRRANSSPS